MDYSQFLYMHDELSLLLLMLVIFLCDLIWSPSEEGGKGKVNTVLPVVLMFVQTLYIAFAPHVSGEAFSGMYVVTPLMTILKAVLSFGTTLVFLMAHAWLSKPENHIKQGEFYVLTICTLLGMYFMISAAHFLMFFIGLELASVPMTALVAFNKRNQESAEASAKYILTALFSSSLLLYGISLVYVSCGTLYFADLAGSFNASNVLQLAALVLFISGIGFKISLVPFHLWTADTYQGAPTAVTGYLSVISKGAAAFVLFVVLDKVFSSLLQQWDLLLFWIVVFSITIANIFAVRQNNIKRFMAFSAISQAGYLVLGVLGGTEQGMTALVYYLLIYMLANLGIFAIICAVEHNSGKVNISDYHDFYRTNPRLSFVMTLCLFSLAGIPPFAGFFSKFFIFMAGFHAGNEVLVFIALLNTIIALYYYLLIVKAMFIQKSEAPIACFRSDNYTRVGLVVCLVGVVFVGLCSPIYHYIDFNSIELFSNFLTQLTN